MQALCYHDRTEETVQVSTSKHNKKLATEMEKGARERNWEVFSDEAVYNIIYCMHNIIYCTERALTQIN